MRRGEGRLRVGSTVVVVVAAAAILTPGSAQAGGLVTKTFSSGNIDKAVPNSDSNPSRIRVPVSGRLKDVNVLIRLTHPDLADIYTIGLDNPANQQGFGYGTDLASGGFLEGADLGAGPGNCSDTLTRFDDEAVTSVGDATAPYAGAVRPDASLDVFDGHKMKGLWVLDPGNQGVPGVLHCWKLQLKYRP